MENLLVPFRTLDSLPWKRVLVLAPHPDDEVFGCGGTLARLAIAHAAIQVIVVTDGAARTTAPQETIATREGESRAAAALLGLPEPVFWRLPDRGLSFGEALVSRIGAAITAWQADLVLAPSALEIHPDHYALALATAEAVRRCPHELAVAFYETSCPLRPTALVDISPVLEKKRAAMACFRSELRFQAYDEQIAALNRYRSYTLPPNVQAAEAFLLLDRATLIRDWLTLFAPEARFRRDLGLPVLPVEDAPLVSVLVRSMDRATLEEVLDAVALQTWRNVEIVVAAARPEHRPLADQWRGLPLRFVPTPIPLSRPAAANVALRAARGAYCLFLDDDDLIAPDHLARLVAALAKNPKAHAAYAGVVARDDVGADIGLFDEPFSAARLMVENYLPIHAVLFARSLVDEGCQFDEGLAVYEDWDFWLQLSRRTAFVHVSGISAVYRMGGNSNVGLTASEEDKAEARLRIYAKWRTRFTPEDYNALYRYHKEWRNTQQRQHELETQLAETHRKAQALEAQLAEARQQAQAVEAQLAEARHQVQSLLASTSWRITAPLRHVALVARRGLAGLRALVSARTRHGGLRPLFQRVLNIWQHEGVSGVLARMQRATSSHTGVGNYDEWVRRYDTLTADELASLARAAQGLGRRPLISVLMPTYNSDERWLRRAIESVLAQVYTEWELCIVDDASTEPRVRAVLEEYRQRDPRIKVVYRPENGHISAASNSALALAQGEYVALLDHDDELPPHALYWVAREIAAHPEAELIYSDEDKIDTEGRRMGPYFKPDWNPELLRVHNLVSHLGVYRTARVRALGGFRAGFEGSQDWDLALRVAECLKPEQIRHVPRVLYHWRMIPGSTSVGGHSKPYALMAGLRAVEDHLARMGVAASVATLDEYPGNLRVHYLLSGKPPMVSLILPFFDSPLTLQRCIRSILAKTDYPSYEILTVSNEDVSPATASVLESLLATGKVRILQGSHGSGYEPGQISNGPQPASISINGAVRAARGEVIALLDARVEVISPGWLEEMVSIALRPEVGAVGALLWYPDGRLAHGGLVLVKEGVLQAFHGLRRGEPGYCVRAVVQQNFSAVSGACLVTEKRKFLEVGGLDETLGVACRDVDFCLRLRAKGYWNVWTPYSELSIDSAPHVGNPEAGVLSAGSNGPASRCSDFTTLLQRWGQWFERDPAYNLNLASDRMDFTFAWPPRQPPLEAPLSAKP